MPHTAAIGQGFGAHRDRKGAAGLKSAKKRPLPLDLTKGQGVGVDPELQVHMDEVASARSAKSSGMSSLHHTVDNANPRAAATSQMTAAIVGPSMLV